MSQIAALGVEPTANGLHAIGRRIYDRLRKRLPEAEPKFEKFKGGFDSRTGFRITMRGGQMIYCWLGETQIKFHAKRKIEFGYTNVDFTLRADFNNVSKDIQERRLKRFLDNIETTWTQIRPGIEKDLQTIAKIKLLMGGETSDILPRFDEVKENYGHWSPTVTLVTKAFDIEIGLRGDDELYIEDIRDNNRKMIKWDRLDLLNLLIEIANASACARLIRKKK